MNLYWSGAAEERNSAAQGNLAIQNGQFQLFLSNGIAVNIIRRRFHLIDFRIQPSKPAPGSKKCLQGRSGGSAIDCRTSLDKEVLL